MNNHPPPPRVYQIPVQPIRTNHRPTLIQKGGHSSTPIKETTAPIKTRTKQNKTKQNKTKQNKTKQNKTKQNKTKQQAT